MSAPLLSVTGAVKRFGGVQALRGVDFDLKAGEIHALLGENGAGKSTLMNLLVGRATRRTRARSRSTAAPVRFANPREAQAAGIATIFQELDLVPSLDVAANLFLGRELMRPGGFLDVAGHAPRGAQAARGHRARHRSPTRLVGDLSIGQRQVVAIVKALSYASRVLIMDEPTAALTVGEVERLFDIMRKLAASGVGIVYISHRLEEVPQIADRVTVMRDGRVAGVTAPRRAAGRAGPAAGRPPARRALSAARASASASRCCILRDASFRPGARERRLAGAAGRLARRARGRDRRPRRHHGRRPHRAAERALRHRPVRPLAGRRSRSTAAPVKLELDHGGAPGRHRLRHRRPARQRPDAAHGGRPATSSCRSSARISPIGLMSARARRRRR